MDQGALVKLAEIFNPIYLARALALVRADVRIAITEEAEAHAFRAEVGTDDESATVHFRFRERGARFLINSTCTCAIGANCEHTAAAIVTLLTARSADTRQLGFDMSPPPAIRPAVDRWISRLALVGHVAAEAVYDKAIGYIFYSSATELCPTISVVTLPRKTDGNFGKPTSNNPYTISMSSLEYVTPIDRAIAHTMRSLSQLRDVAPQARQAIYDDLLTRIIATGRAYFESTTRPPLFRVESISAQLAWHYFDDDSQRLVIEADSRHGIIYGLRSFAVELASGACAAIDLGLDADEMAIVLEAPFVNSREARKIAETTTRRRSLARIPTPSGVTITRETGEPRVQLQVTQAPGGGLELRLGFVYGGIVVTIDDHTDAVHIPQDEGVHILDRDAEIEREARFELMRLQCVPQLVQSETIFSAPLASRAELLHARLPELATRGWEIHSELTASGIAIADAPWHAHIAEREGAWFSLGLDLDIAGERIAAVPLLLALLRRLPPQADIRDITALGDGRYVYLTLADGRDIALPAQRAQHVLATLFTMQPTASANEDTVHVTLADIHTLLQAAGDEIRPSDARYAFAEQDTEADERDFDAALARDFVTTLRPYQRTGVAWLRRIARQSTGGLLADDMGLGKTVQTLAHIVLERAAGHCAAPVLVIMPTTLLPNWQAETTRFAPSLRQLTLTGAQRSSAFGRLDESDIVFTTYAILLRDAQEFTSRTWQAVILDEAQFIKNAQSKTAQTARLLRAKYRLCLTGTPIENNLAELWSLFAFALPGLLGSYRHFARCYRVPIEKHGDSERSEALRRAIAPFLLRRTKERVAPELPPRTEIVQTIELYPEQRELYEIVRTTVDARVRKEIQERGLGSAKVVILDALLKLRQVCCDPRLLKAVDASQNYPSAKLDALIEHIEALCSAGRRILIFSQFTSMLRLIGAALQDRLIDFALLTGDTVDRAAPLARFQNREVPVFLISLKAGGFGINLTAADTVIHYDPWWNPAAERQASDRAHRIGQENPVFIYKYTAAGSVEERIHALQRRKGALADALFDPAASTPQGVVEEDIHSLFAPLDEQ